MNEPDVNLPKPKYKWPWFALAMVVLGIVLAVVWMSFAVHRLKEQRNPNPPSQSR